LAPVGEAPVPDVAALTGYVDLQVNGYAGVDFNKDALTASELHHACARLEADGVAAFLPTIITDDVEVMCRRLSALVRAREQDSVASRLIAGIHVEGPFLNEAPGFRGAHPQDALRDADPEVMKRLLDAAAGLTRIVTLAPERDPDGRVIRMLTASGIIVSGGHSDASMDQLRAAIDAGLSMFTHVGNGCPMQMHRHDNIVQRVLSLAPELWLSFIADGAHVPFVALGNYLTLAGYDRTVIVTDAIAPAGLGPGRYTLGRWDIVVDSDMVPRSPDRSHFLGSAVTMQQSADNLRRALNVPSDALRRLTSDNPARVIGL
jgi:N-acetylglucosamine-6-phosphate deacetylase